MMEKVQKQSEAQNITKYQNSMTFFLEKCFFEGLSLLKNVFFAISFILD